jgi:hypothetical protein
MNSINKETLAETLTLSELEQARHWDLWENATRAIEMIEKHYPKPKTDPNDKEKSESRQREDERNPVQESQHQNILRLSQQVQELARPAMPIEEWEQENVA